MTPKAQIPDRLVEDLDKGEVVLFIGLDAGRGSDRELGFPTTRELTRELMDRCSYPPHDDHTPTLHEVASYYEAIRGRHELERYIIDRFDDPRVPPNKVHRLAARLPFSLIVTAVYGRMMERAFELPPSQPYFAAIADRDAPFIEADKKLVLKLCGTVDRPDTLIVTRQDLAKLFDRIPSLNVMLLSEFAKKTWLFLDHHLQGDIFEHLYYTVQRTVDRHARRVYAVLESPSSVTRALWSSHLEIIDSNSSVFLEELEKRLSLVRTSQNRGARRPRPRTTALPKAPYKFLDFFVEDDEPIFRGRDDEADRLARQVTSQKISLLVGQSGTGKTSLLRARVAPLLEAEGYRVHHIRVLSDPADLIKRSAIPERTRLRATTEDAIDLRTLRGFLEETLPNGSRVAFLIDQFEEFFIRLGDASRQKFAESIVDCMASPVLDLRFLLALREDYFHRLMELDPPIADIFAHRFWLPKLTETQAREAIREPAALFGLTWDDGLLNVLLRDLNTGGIDPPQLQIICHRLYLALRGKTCFTLELYHQLGGPAILAKYLDEVLDALTADEQAGARAVLKSMVTAEQTKAVVSAREIARDAIVRRLGMSDDEVMTILRALQDHRVIRRLSQESEVYELAHEVMVGKIWQWIDAADVHDKYVKQVLRQALADWRATQRLPGREQWNLLQQAREHLVLDRDEATLLLRASLDAGEDVAWWIEEATKAGTDVWAQLELVLQEGAPIERQHALAWVATQARKVTEALRLLTIALRSEYPALRRRAVRALTDLDTEEARQILDAHPAPNDEVLIPAGSFIMGRSDGRADEKPEHEVYLDAYYIARFPVTNIEYLEFIQATDHVAPTHWQGSTLPTGLEDHPVVGVSWYDAEHYCEWLSLTRGRPYRLLTEAEWEKAAGWDERSNRKRKWSWGDEFDPIKCNTFEKGPRSTTPIGQYSPAGGDSPYGVAEMCGNTFDWVSDWYGRTYYEVSPTDNPSGPETGDLKMARGGSWAGFAKGASVASRDYSRNPDVRNEYIGFRVARRASATPTSEHLGQKRG